LISSHFKICGHDSSLFSIDPYNYSNIPSDFSGQFKKMNNNSPNTKNKNISYGNSQNISGYFLNNFSNKIDNTFDLNLNLDSHHLAKLRHILKKLREHISINKENCQGLIKAHISIRNKVNFMKLKRIVSKWKVYRIKPQYLKSKINENMGSNKVGILHNQSQMCILNNCRNKDQWKKVICEGDGNCMLRSISVHTFGSQELY